MVELDKSSDPLETAGAQFRTTAWSIVQAAGDPEAPDAASALADLLTQPDTETRLTSLPFVHHRSRRWEYEPLRWMGINAALGLATWADRCEQKGTTSRASRYLERIIG